MSEQDRKEWWDGVRKASKFHSPARQPGLFKYTVQCVGMMRTVFAYVRGYDADQARAKAKSLYPRCGQYNVIKEVACAGYEED